MRTAAFFIGTRRSVVGFIGQLVFFGGVAILRFVIGGMVCSGVWWIFLCIAPESISEGVVLSTVLFLFRCFIVLFWLLSVWFNGEFGDVFLFEDFVERGLVKAASSLTAFWIF